MFANIRNENYGYAVATYGDYVAISNPPILRWTAATASVHYTGSVDYFRYNKSTDQHDYITTVCKDPEEIDVVLITESSSLTTYPMYNIDTEPLIYGVSDLLIDKTLYTASVEDGFGTTLDMYQKLLIIGSPYFTQIVTTSASIITASSATVEIHDLSRTEFIPASSSTLIYKIYNPETSITNSFGQGVSINNSWIAIGSPYISSSLGTVYMYKNISTGSNYSWSFFQALSPSQSLSNALFGWDLKLNKQTGSISQSLVVGCGNPANGLAYYFEFVSGSWVQTFQFSPTADIYPLTFGNYAPYSPTLNITNGYGYSVSTFGPTVVIGSYTDRSVYEYSGSSLFQQGSVYVYEKCPELSYTKFKLVLKTYGNENILKNNRLGYSVDVFDTYAIAGSPKINNLTMDSCYIGGTINQLHYCNGDLETLMDGQTMLLHKNTSSNEWGITNIYQRKKRYLSPYRSYGNDVSIADRSIVIGAPMILSDSSRQININVTESNNVELDDITGKAYIYNLKNLRNQFHVGNVFYRNGKVVIMTSGSNFDGLFFNPINTNTYEYDLSFKSQHTIFEKQIVCTVNSGEFNVSTNPTAVDKITASLDINKNGIFDFQDVDILLKYMQYKYTALLGVPISTDWTSSILKTDDEISLYNFYITQNGYNPTQTSQFASQSIVQWELVDTSFQNVLDLNEDNRIDIRDMNIMWKYFANRLTQENYSTYITPSCKRKLFSDIIDYMNFISQKNSIPKISTGFLNYEQLSSSDKTGSFLAPLVTTIGLYDGLDLVSIAKLGSPIKITPELPINFVVKMDY